MLKQDYENKLINEKSPYLLQHAHNPVYWYPWGEEAFERAMKEDKPIFLSIGYSTCHWCHVMERESFEDFEVASALNENFISIKVDREERPDIDHIYMAYCQAFTGQGGWPLSIFLTPNKEPFYAGTYFPKHNRYGMSGFLSVLEEIKNSWQTNKQKIAEYSSFVVKSLEREKTSDTNFNPKTLLNKAYTHLKNSFESTFGGFSTAPKFPTPHNLIFLLRTYYKSRESTALDMVEKNLVSMYKGGIFDHIGFGFCRYSTDKKWLVPHFEKMLYDNALLATTYLEAYKITKKELYADIARKIFTYILRDMTSPQGGFYSAEDADSEGHEGKFYVFTYDEIKELLQEDGELFCRIFGVTKEGNFEGKNILNLINSTIDENQREFIENCRQKLYTYREGRIHPFKDDKILTGWNGLMIAALAIGGKILKDENYIRAAEKAADFILNNLVRQDGRLLARYRDGDSSILAYVDDYAFLIWSLLELYETSFKEKYLALAIHYNDELLRLFWDNNNGGLFMNGSDGEVLIIRPKEIYDGAIPSGNSVSALNFLRLARLTNNSELEELANKQFKAFGSQVSEAPSAYTFFSSALLFSEALSKEIIIAGETIADTKAMLDIISEHPNPFINTLVFTNENKEIAKINPSITSYQAIDGKPTAYVCEGYSCKPPITDIKELEKVLN